MDVEKQSPTIEQLADQIENLQYDRSISGTDGIYQVLAGRILEAGLDADLFELNTPYRKIGKVLHKSRLRSLQDNVTHEQREWHLFMDLIDFLISESVLPQFENDYFIPLSVGEKCDCIATILREPDWLLGMQRQQTKSDTDDTKRKFAPTEVFIIAVYELDECTPEKRIKSGEVNKRINNKYSDVFLAGGPAGTVKLLGKMKKDSIFCREEGVQGFWLHPDSVHLIDKARKYINKYGKSILEHKSIEL